MLVDKLCKLPDLMSNLLKVMQLNLMNEEKIKREVFHLFFSAYQKTISLQFKPDSILLFTVILLRYKWKVH